MICGKINLEVKFCRWKEGNQAQRFLQNLPPLLSLLKIKVGFILLWGESRANYSVQPVITAGAATVNMSSAASGKFLAQRLVHISHVC